MKYSVIIPAYNCESCVGACLESVRQCGMDDFEVLLIDDGSTDHTFEVARKYAEKDPRIIVFQQKNQGPSVARNFGLKRATGEYVLFLDSDDFFTNGIFREITPVLNRTHCDLAVSNMLLFDDTSKKYTGSTDPNLTGEQISCCEQSDVLQYLGAMRIAPSPCRYITKRSVLIDNSLYFKEGIQHEDTMWMPMLLCNCYSFQYISKPFYNIRMRQGSRGKLNGVKRIESLYTILEHIEQFRIDRVDSQQQFLDICLCVDTVFLVGEVAEADSSIKKQARKWFHDHRNMIDRIKRNRHDIQLLSAVVGNYNAFMLHSYILKLKNRLVNSK